MENLRHAISGMRRRWLNLSDSQRKTLSPVYKTEMEMYKTFLSFFRTQHEMDHKEDLKALIEEVEELKRMMNLKKAG